jgi:hypothetical protein
VRSYSLPQTHAGTLINIMVTQYFVFLGWLIFRVENLSDLIYCAEKFIFIDFISVNVQNIALLTVGFLFLLTIVLLPNKKSVDRIAKFFTNDWISYFSTLKLEHWLFYMIATMSLLLCFSPSSSPEFIYFQF